MSLPSDPKAFYPSFDVIPLGGHPEPKHFSPSADTTKLIEDRKGIDFRLKPKYESKVSVDDGLVVDWWWIGGGAVRCVDLWW